MVSVSVTADDCFGEDYIIDNQPVGAKTHKIVRRPQGSGFQSSQLLMSVYCNAENFVFLGHPVFIFQPLPASKI